MSTKPSALVLGTAMWGWTLDEATCFAIMDAYYQEGGRFVDGATNYPINKSPADFRKAEQILQNWIKSRGVTDLRIMMKVGSINNLRGPENNLTPSFLLLCAQEYEQAFGEQLDCLMIHWDNREDHGAIRESLETIVNWPGADLGLSGIKHPDVYAQVLTELAQEKCWLQLKHNVIYSDYERYQSLHPYVRCIAYGINAGGLKLGQQSYGLKASLLARGGKPDQHQELVLALNALVTQFGKDTHRPVLQKMNHIGMLHALLHPAIERILIGVSSVEQLADSFAWERVIREHHYQDWYEALLAVMNKQKEG